MFELGPLCGGVRGRVATRAPLAMEPERLLGSRIGPQHEPPYRRSPDAQKIRKNGLSGDWEGYSCLRWKRSAWKFQPTPTLL
jgi:hypothetical protein